MGYKVAVVGATGNVGREMLEILAERGFPADEVVALASRRSQGTEVSFGDKTLKIVALDQYDFNGTDICLMSAGGDISKEWSPKIAAAGCVVIDNSSAYRYDPDVPLVVPEVNADDLDQVTKKGIVANPNCSTIQLMVALKPIHDRAKIKRVNCATYQSVSGAGQAAIEFQWPADDILDPLAWVQRGVGHLIDELDLAQLFARTLSKIGRDRRAIQHQFALTRR